MVPKAPGKPVEELITTIKDGLSGLNELFAITPGITDDDRAKLTGIMEEYKSLVTENLGAAPGEPIKKEGTVQLDQMSPEAGTAKVMPAL